MTRHNGLTPEQQVVLACAHGQLTSDSAGDVAQPAPRGINWTVAQVLPARNGIGYFRASHLLALARAGAAALPPSFERELRIALWGADVHGNGCSSSSA